MRESVKDFIERVVAGDMIIRVEANDTLPIRDSRENILDKVDGLYVIDFEIVDFNNITIRATYQRY